MTNYAEQIRSALAELGSTREEVYTNLKAGRYHGDQKSCLSCPIARYLNLKISDRRLGEAFRVGPVSIELQTPGSPTFCRVATPDPVMAFIIWFDGNKDAAKELKP